MEIDLDTWANLEFAPQGIDGLVDEVLARGLQRKGLVSVNVQADASSLGIAEPQFIMERNGLKDSADFVVRIGALAEDVQAQVDFGERWDSDFAHAAIAAWLPGPKTSGLRDASFDRASFRFRRFSRFPHQQAERDAIRRE